VEYDAFRAGTGRPLVLLHSGMCTWVEWRRTADRLIEDRDVLAPTLPGSSGGPRLERLADGLLRPQADHVEGMLDAAGWREPVDIVGSSYGGVLALELLARGRAARVVALAPPWVTGAGIAFYGALFGSALPGIALTRPFRRWTTRSGVLNGLFFQQSTVRPQIDPADVGALLDSAGTFPFFRLGLQVGRAGPGMPDLAALDQSRVTLVWGGADRLVPAWMSRRWESALPEAHVVLLPGFPHQPHLRDPQVVVDLI
jgi:pimeloyl-ACP methyl ester carboxylesterase